MRTDLPTGTVTFLFTDVEGSTKLLHELGAEGYAQALAGHRRILREAFRSEGGVEVDTQGDAFFYAFPTAPGALAGARAALEGLSGIEIAVRMGLHTGTPLLVDEGYVGGDVHKAARIASAAHGGQLLVSAATAALVERADLRDLGEHRLKDLSAPERIYQLGEEQFPPLKTLYQTNLPIPATPFLGRERELGEVVSLLARDESRLLTLTGPGGSGKTRLALQSAAALAEHYPHGVWWVPLAPLRDPQLVLETASSALGAKNGLADHVGDKRLLLLFDNFEHVLEAAMALSPVLSSCPNLDLLVTSREPLHVSGEQEYEVPPLAHEEAVGFFASRARAVEPRFEVDDSVAGICERLDDLPLALELAAARAKTLTPRQILERLEQRLPLLTGGTRDAPERQRTLRATIEWSHDLLSPEEQRLFSRLAVFRGGCTLEAAEAITDADLDTLQALVDKSLVRRREERYWMLETIREFAFDRLEATGAADDLRQRHAEYFLALAEEAEPHLRAHEMEWLDRTDADRDNLRAGLDWLEGSGDTQAVLRMAGALGHLWYLLGLWPENWRRIEAALAADDTPTAARAKALREAGATAVVIGDFDTARLRIDDAVSLSDTIGEPWGIAYSRFLRGFAAVEGGDFEAALPPLEESRRLFRELQDEHALGIVTFNLAWAYDELGEPGRARELTEENLQRADALGDRRLRSFSLSELAYLQELEGKLDSALASLKESLHITHHTRDPVHTAFLLNRIGSFLAQNGGDADIAATILARAMQTHEDVGVEVPPYVAKRRDQGLAALRERLDDATLTRLLAEGRRVPADDAVNQALQSSLGVEDLSAERDEARLVEP